MPPVAPTTGRKSLGAADLNRPRLTAPSSRTAAVTPSAPAPLDPWEKVRAALASPRRRAAQGGAQQTRKRLPESESTSTDSSEVHIDDDLSERIAAAFALPKSRRFGLRQGDKAKEQERNVLALDKGDRTPRNAGQSEKAEARGGQKAAEQVKAKLGASRTPVEKKPEKANAVGNKPPVAKTLETAKPSGVKPLAEKKPIKAKPAVAKPPVQKKAEKVKPKATNSPFRKNAQQAKPTVNKAPIRATVKATVDAKTDAATAARTKSSLPASKAVAATDKASTKSNVISKTVQKSDTNAPAAPRPPPKPKPPESSVQEEEFYESPWDSSVKVEEELKDNRLFPMVTAAAVLDRVQAYGAQAQYLWPQYPNVTDAAYPMTPPSETINVASSEPSGVVPYWSGVASVQPTAIIYAEGQEEDTTAISDVEQRHTLWMLDTDYLPQPPDDDESIDRRMAMTLVSTSVLVAMLTLVVMCVAVVSMLLQAGVDDEITSNAPTTRVVT